MYDESKHIQVAGNAVAVSGGAGTIATVKWMSESSNLIFEEVPKKKKLVLTDVIYNPQGDVSAPHTINIAEKYLDGGPDIIIQFIVPPKATQQTHFHTGLVIEPEKKVGAWERHNRFSLLHTRYRDGVLAVFYISPSRLFNHRSR